VMSDEMIANDLGVDIEDVYVQRAREAEMRKLYGLKDEQERQEEQMQQQADALADRNEERSEETGNGDD
jgi:capsid protein